MFAPLSHLPPRRPDSAEPDTSFVQGLRVQHPREPRSRRSELVLVVCWLLVLAKSLGVWWLCETYPQVKVSPWWVIGPTLLFASLCTWLYVRRD